MDIQEVRTLPGISARDAYYAAVEALPKAGFAIWKKRDFGWFAIARKNLDGREVTANIMSKPGKETTLELRLNADGVDEAALRPLIEQFYTALDGVLKK